MTATWTGTRTFGRSGTTVSALGLGTWAIGGPAWLDGKPIGWGQVDDAESLRAIHRALDLGIAFFDTAPVYGAGRSERLLGQALAGRHDATIATKFGLAIDEDRRLMTGVMTHPDPALIRSDCEASLRRLNVEAIDLFLCHPSELPVVHAAEVRDILEDLVAEGKIRGHGWSTDDVAGAAIFAAAPTAAPSSTSSTSSRTPPPCSPSASGKTWPASPAPRWRWASSPASSTPPRPWPATMCAATNRPG